MLKVRFTKEAWRKQCALITHFNTEVAWHGLVREIEGGYEIYDILVYPQVVTGGTVETDQQKYQMWLMQQPDEIFNAIRYQGHSHVRMQPYPSGVDLQNQERMDVPKDDFYLFFIWNKEWYYTARIYDHGVMFEHDLVDLDIEEGDKDPFIIEAEKMLERKVLPVLPVRDTISYLDTDWYKKWKKNSAATKGKKNGRKRGKK